jgi:WhiB family redox-sensing transcriptional regulator
VNIYTATRIYREHMEPTADPRELEWQDAALCAQSDPEAWFPEKGASAHFPKQICRACPVRIECLGYALEGGQTFGVWGGLTERARRQAAREHAAGTSLDDIIAADDKRHYERAERSAASNMPVPVPQPRKAA